MPPVVKFCPETQHYTVAKHHETIKVSWIEPIFEDNIKVTTITKSNVSNHFFFIANIYYIFFIIYLTFIVTQKKFDAMKNWQNFLLKNNPKIILWCPTHPTQESGNHLGLGTHLITYEAKDAAGFSSRCTFKIVINVPKRQILPLLYSKFYYL